MPTIALDVLDWIERHPDATPATKRKLLAQVPAHQWATVGGHWADLAKHCSNRAEVLDEPRFMNRLSIYRMQPLPRCLFRSPDGRGLAWMKSGGPLESYGICEQMHCERARQAPDSRPPSMASDSPSVGTTG